MARDAYVGSDQASTVLLTNIQGDLTELFANLDEVVAARDGEDDLITKLGVMETATTTVSDEVIAARAGEADLITKINLIDNAILAVNDSDGSLISSNDTTPAFLNDKITVSGGGITKSITSPAGNEKLNLNITPIGFTVDTATTDTVLTSTSTLLNITPTSYGVSVTLPDATTCEAGLTRHIVDNKSGYPIKIIDDDGTIKGFVAGDTVCRINCVDISTAAGVWSIENNELVGITGSINTSVFDAIVSCVRIDDDREFILGDNTSGYSYGVVYNSTTNVFGSATLIRGDAVHSRQICIKSGTDQILVISCINSSTAFEAVVLTISGTTITVGTPDTATLSANIATDIYLIQVGASFITSYGVTGSRQIREITISGTTPTLSAATTLDGTASGYIVNANDTHVLAFSTATTHLYTKPYAIGGLAAGTGTDTDSGTMGISKLTPLGTRWAVIYVDGSNIEGGIVSCTSGTSTITADVLFPTGSVQDAIVVDGKLLVMNNQTTNNANILTDTAGTASAGSAITVDSETYKRCIYVSGTDVYISSGTTIHYVSKLDCSGATPVIEEQLSYNIYNAEANYFGLSDAFLNRSASSVYVDEFVQTVSTLNSATSNYCSRLHKGIYSKHLPMIQANRISGFIRGASDAERWGILSYKIIQKWECAQ